MSQLRVGLVGYGLAGRVFHAPLLRACPQLALVAVVTTSAERAGEVTSDHAGHARRDEPAPSVRGDLATMLARDRLDLVVVASTTGTHAQLAGQAVDAGVACVVDKPLAVHAAQAADLVARAQSAGVPLTVFQNRRWDSDTATVAHLMAAGALGTVHRLESRFERWRPQARPQAWRERLPAAEGGGLLLDLGSHLVDQATMLLGPAVGVYAEVAALRGLADDDDFLAIEHASGARSHLWASALAGRPGPRLRVQGSGGAYLVEALDGQEDVLRATGVAPVGGWVPPATAWGVLVRGEASWPVPSRPGRWDSFYPAVAAALEQGTAMPVDPLDAVRTLGVLDAAATSAREHRVVAVAPR